MARTGTPTNIVRVSKLVCSQDDDLGTSKRKFHEIQREASISRSTVRRIAKDDLKLKIFRRREVQQLSDSDAKKRLHACMRIDRRMTDMLIKLNERGLVTRRYSLHRLLQTLKMIVSMLLSRFDTWKC